MNDEDRINKINNELKTYINEAKFISNKCRNRIIKLLGEEFNIIIDKSNIFASEKSLPRNVRGIKKYSDGKRKSIYRDIRMPDECQ